MIEKWLVVIRDHPNRPAALQQLVLERLALRMDWATGAGFAGIRDLMADAGAGRDTVMRATRWAIDEHLLLQTRRGHYISAQTTIASQWQLTQPATGDTLAMTQGVSGETLAPTQSRTGATLAPTQSRNGTDPKSQSGRPKVAAQTTHQESSTSQPSKRKSMVAPEERPGPEAMVSRRARTSGASARISSQDKIDGTRFAIADIYGESWNKTISDEEVLALFTLKAPSRKRVTNVTAYMRKIFEDTPAFDTLLAQLDNETGDGDDDYDLATEAAKDTRPWACPQCGGTHAERDTFLDLCAFCVREGIIAGKISDTRHVIPNTVECPRCEAASATGSGICVWCEAELEEERQKRPPVPVEGWNVSILKAVQTALFVTTGKTVDDEWAAKVADQILGAAKTKVTAPVRYITTTISNDGNPARFLPTPGPS